MKTIYSKLILLILDLFLIALSIILAYFLRVTYDGLFPNVFNHNLSSYLFYLPIYIVSILIFTYEGIYTKRFDFWQETFLILKSLILSFLVILSLLAMTKSIDNTSRVVIILTYMFMVFLIPIGKNITKKKLFKMGLWKREAQIQGDDEFLSEEIYHNHYLGYVKPAGNEAKTVFINTKNVSVSKLKEIIDKEIRLRHEVIFIPIVNDYNMAASQTYELFNTRTNLVVFKNRLKSKYRNILHELFNYLLAILLLPILLPIIAILAILIKKESPGPVFFAHNRIGKNGKTIPTYKFRSMYADAQDRLEKLLAEDEEIRKEWETNFKLKEDPRVTKIGAVIRKTSLDELPQIWNVFRGEMSFVGPRPVIQQEIDQYYKEDAEYYFMVKPGITGLWQVSGRSDTDYDFRIETDKWYVRNWSLWLDIVILFKTVKVVLFKEGAY